MYYFIVIYLGGKCRYCKQKIRPRYFLLEILSGIVFVLFAMAIKLSIFTVTISTMVYFVFALLYFVTLFIIAGIDKEKRQIQKSVLLLHKLPLILRLQRKEKIPSHMIIQNSVHSYPRNPRKRRLQKHPKPPLRQRIK